LSGKVTNFFGTGSGWKIFFYLRLARPKNIFLFHYRPGKFFRFYNRADKKYFFTTKQERKIFFCLRPDRSKFFFSKTGPEFFEFTAGWIRKIFHNKNGTGKYSFVFRTGPLGAGKFKKTVGTHSLDSRAPHEYREPGGSIHGNGISRDPDLIFTDSPLPDTSYGQGKSEIRTGIQF